MKPVSSCVRKAVPVAVEPFSIRKPFERFMRQALGAQPAFLVRGSSRRIMSMRFRPANIRVINRRVERLGRHSRRFPRAREKQRREAPRNYSLTRSAISERELQGELDGARAAYLIQRIETAVSAARTEAARQGLRRMAEERTWQDVIGRPEIGMIENVEELPPEPQVPLLGERKLPLESHVRLCRAESAQHVAPEIALCPRRCRFERVFV